MPTGKILATIVGIFTVALLANQLFSSQAKPIVENFVNVALRARSHEQHNIKGHVTDKRANCCGKDLTTGFPDSVFFGNQRLQPMSVMGSGVQASNSDLGAAVNFDLNAEGDSAKQFASFAAAAGVVDPRSVVEGYHNSAPGSGSGHRRHHHHRQGLSNVRGCGPEGTIMDLTPPGLPSSLTNKPTVITTNLETATLPVRKFNALTADGSVTNVMSQSRMVYSTLTRARCPGTVDFIRGDLPIANCPQQSMPAARPGDTLCTGAMLGLFGTGETAKATVAMVAADTGSVYTAMGGYNAADIVMQPKEQSALTTATFAETNTAKILENMPYTQMQAPKMTVANTMRGEASAQAGGTGGVTLVSGVSSY